MRIRYNILFLVVALVFNSCLEEESPVERLMPGPVETVQVEMEFPYRLQVYYDCNTNTILKSNSRFDWDISFESSSEGYHVLANTAKSVFVAILDSDNIEEEVSVSDLDWKWDVESGHLDSTVMKDWRGEHPVYVLDLQYDLMGRHLGYKKIKLLAVSEESYRLQSANLDGSSLIEHLVEKEENLNFVHFTFSNGGERLLLEPMKDDWDLLFSNHYHKFSNLPLPFVLTQVLINKENGVLVAENSDSNFEELELRDTANYSFTNDWDEIGYDWKVRNNQDNSFAIDTDKSFLVKDTEGFFFKLRFVDFYNDNGEKGYPKFEIQKL